MTWLGDPMAALFGPIDDPVLVFLIIMGIILVAPLLVERFNLPGIIGLIGAGVVVGPYGLGILERDASIVLLGTVGLLLLMFMAGLETSLDDLKLNVRQSLIFGLATFSLPMILGTAVMQLLGYGWLASLLVASCLATHTLVALPVVSRLGLSRLPAFTATLGGTIIANVLGLLILAVVIRAFQGSLSWLFWLTLIPSLICYTILTLWGVPRLGRWFFRRFGWNESAEFTFVLAVLLVVSYGAKLIGIEPVVGAFLAGIAITPLIPRLSSLMNRLEFIGNTLFIPFFLVSVGMLIDPAVVFRDPQTFLVSTGITVAELLAKLGAAWLVVWTSGWGQEAVMVIFGLSLAQAAATLAAITVGYQVGLVDTVVVNATIVMIMVTCMLSPWVTAHWGKKLAQEPQLNPTTAQTRWGSRVLVPVANPQTEKNLLTLAILLAKHHQGTLLPLNILIDHGEGVDSRARQQQKLLLTAAETEALAAAMPVQVIGRISDSLSKGILRTAWEQQASLIILGWKGYSSYRENLFGSLIDSLIRQKEIPVLITRLVEPLVSTKRVVVGLLDWEVRFPVYQQVMTLGKILAQELKANLHLILVSEHSGSAPACPTDGISCQQMHGNFVQCLADAAQVNDLLILVPRPDRNGLGSAPQALSKMRPDISLVIASFPETDVLEA